MEEITKEINEIKENIIKPSMLNITAVLVPITIPTDSLIQFIRTHSNSLIGFMPIFKSDFLDPDLQDIPGKMAISIPANLNQLNQKQDQKSKIKIIEKE
ncbi:TPA: hypothetical protein ENX78_06725 [Candidatus Poribacteria bacterium]|nr:hypothetical protein [Candidatus Poribacteria bacterium]